MSYNGKSTSFVSVVESAFRSSGLDFIDFENAIEWTAELMGLIGTPYVYIDKTTNGLNGAPSALQVENYRCKLPSDLETLTSIDRAVLDSDGEVSKSYEMVESTNLFHPTNNRADSELSSANWDPLVEVNDFEIKDGELTNSPAQISPSSDAILGNNEYKIHDGYIFTNFKDGYVRISYRGFAIDPDGFPLIPDDAKFKAALKYHIIAHLDWITWRKNPSPQNKSIANDSEQRRDFYVGAARNKSHIPSIDKMESIKRMWLRSIPKINEHGTGFSTLNKQERRYTYNTKNRRRRR